MIPCFPILCLLVLVGLPVGPGMCAELHKLNNKSVEWLSDSGKVDGITYKFIEKENFYSFRGEFVTYVDYDCLLAVSFELEHKLKYNKNVSSIKLIKGGSDNYVVRYVIEKFLIIKNTSYWLLRLHPEKKMISYRMLSNESNMQMYDVVNQSGGYYKFIKLKKGYKVIYYQESTLEPGFLMRPYLSVAKDEAIKFMSDYKAYLKQFCNP
jgi:hypothetical protein